jgi:hypothetical protein
LPNCNKKTPAIYQQFTNSLVCAYGKPFYWEVFVRAHHAKQLVGQDTDDSDLETYTGKTKHEQNLDSACSHN